MRRLIFHEPGKPMLIAAMLALFLGIAGMASAAGANQKPAPPKPAPAAKPAPQAPRPAGQAARPSGSYGGGATRGASTSGPSANRPTANRPSANRPTANRPLAGPSANRVGGMQPRPGGVPPNQSMQRRGAGGADSGRNSPIRASAPRGSSERHTSYGSTVRSRSDGRISDVHDPKRGIDVHHGLNGNRRISVERADHSRVFAERGRPGYVQHPYSFHGHDFARRTYFYHGREYSRFYHGFGYRGMYLNVYAPGVYYRPAFYGWAYNPWAMPIAFGWGWAGDPWFGYYGYYFAPSPLYPSAAYWLTDYLISSDLQSAYAAQQEGGEVDEAPSAAGGPASLTPEVKQQIAEEVREQLALENQEAAQNTQQQDADPASSGIARMVSDGRPHTLVVGSALDVVDSSGNECALSDGDVLSLRAAPPADATAANVVVVASKGGQECAGSDTVSVSLADLQEMQNHMRETIDQGLQDLQAKQGTGGIPSLPPSAQGQPAPAVYAAVAPPPDANAGAEIQQETQQADQAESEVAPDSAAPPSAASAASAAPAAPVSVELGQTPAQVQAALGAPARVANLGARVIYYYSGMKVIFKDGKVSDVQ